MAGLLPALFMSRVSQKFPSIFNGCRSLSAAPRDTNATCKGSKSYALTTGSGIRLFAVEGRPDRQ